MDSKLTLQALLLQEYNDLPAEYKEAISPTIKKIIFKHKVFKPKKVVKRLPKRSPRTSTQVNKRFKKSKKTRRLVK